nr:uncharacterized protein LOC129432444 [Misgurnus anguillicaudatus]
MLSKENISLATRSVCSHSHNSSRSTHSRRSAASLIAIEARAKAEAARARAAYSQREIEIKVKKAQLQVEETRLEATLEALQQEKEAEAALAEATAYEAIDGADIEKSSENECKQKSSTFNALKRTDEYVQDQNAYKNKHHQASKQTPLLQSADREQQNALPSYRQSIQYSQETPQHVNSYSEPLLQSQNTHDSIRPIRVPEKEENTITHYTQPSNYCTSNMNYSPDVGNEPHAAKPENSEILNLAKFLARRDLLTAGLIKFDDKPENYLAWKSTFSNAIEDLNLKPSEELDLLTKWLGPESAEHARRIRSVHINYPAVGLSRIWERLEQCYGSAEAIESALLNKVDCFPRISNRDPQCLRELADLLSEIESAKMDGYLPGLSYLDTARGIAPILEKLPFALQEKWMRQGSRYKQEQNVSFPPFSFFSTFIRNEAHMRNDPSFKFNLPNTMQPTGQKFSFREKRLPVAVHKTEVEHGIPTVKSKLVGEDFSKQCPIHKKPHPLHKCRGFREKPIDERKAFLKEHAICFRCCSSTSHQARNCTSTIQCSECDSERHIAALHPGPAPWSKNETVRPVIHHGGEDDEKTITTVATSSCTKVCGNGFRGRSCSKICLVNIYCKDHPQIKLKTYAILDDQSNKSLAKSTFFDKFNVIDHASPYTLKTCTGTSEILGRRAKGFIIESINDSASFTLPTLIECNELPDNRAEIPTPDAAWNHAHLKSVAHKIPPLDPEAEILLLLGRDIIEVHKVLEQRNGPRHAPFAQKLALGWVIIGDVCLDGAHKPCEVNTFKTSIFMNGRPSQMEPCENNIQIKEKFCHYNEHLTSLAPSLKLEFATTHTKSNTTDIFQSTKDDDKLAPSMEDLVFLKIMQKEVYQDESNSWVAPLPFRSPRQRLPNNRQQASNRLQSLTRTLKKHPRMKDHFLEFMTKMFENRHAEPAPPLSKNEECWYLPIFGVYHPQKPDQIRVVFDSSAQHHGVSLNSVLLTGPNMNNSLLGVLLRFRKEKVAITADIQQMFHCFVVREDHRNFLRFLWYRNNDLENEVVEFRMRVHVFGNSPSPAVAMYGLKKAALEGEKEHGSDVKQFIERNFYVDDALVSLPTEQEAITLLRNAQAILAASNLRLHKIASNKIEVMRAFPPDDLAENLKDLNLAADLPHMQRSLGVSWDVAKDNFTFQVPDDEKPYTRRGILSTVNSLFDPFGFAAPVIIKGRSLLRELTMETCDWDAPLSDNMFKEWKTWRNSLKELEKITISRAYTPTTLSNAQKKEMCIFSDASITAIAAVAYLKTTDSDGKINVGFIYGKAKLTPRPELTIPRLELCAAVLAVEIAETVTDEIDVKFDAVTFYSDSKVVLGYIHNESRRFYVYVNNRVQRIRRSTSPEQWKYVPTNHNPADHASRSVSAENLMNSTWLTGPAFLYKSVEHETTPSTTIDLVDPESDAEIRPEVSVCATEVVCHKFNTSYFEKFSDWQRLINTISRLKHITHSFSNDNKSKECRGWHICHKPHSVEDLQSAKDLIIRSLQQETFQDELRCLERKTHVSKNSPLFNLCPYIDESGLLRIGGRLSQSAFEKNEVNPLILPGRCHVTTLLIRHYHSQVQHQGRHFTEGALRAAGLWIIGGKRRISSIIHHCVTCRKLRGKIETQKMSDLPVDRLSTNPPFSYVGLDVFGPWKITSRRTRGGLANSKCWAVLFTCMSTRAIHIEVIESLDTSSFINALRRFFSIRGPAKQIRSDCGTNFVGASKELKFSTDTNKKEIQNFLSHNGCTWSFNPPHSSHMGGSWERMIGITRRILDAMLLNISQVKFTHEVLITFMAEVSAIVNARPLIPVSTDPNNPLILSPATLLTQKTGTLPPPNGNFKERNLYVCQWRQVQSLANTFWHRWRREYLSTLQNRRKWQREERNLQPGDVVLLKEGQVQRNDWPMGIIQKSFPGNDGRVRKVEVKTIKDGIPKVYLRPISDTVLLLPSKME